MINDEIVLVTDVSSGVARETAQLLAEHSARVFGTMRDFCRNGDLPVDRIFRKRFQLNESTRR